MWLPRFSLWTVFFTYSLTACPGLAFPNGPVGVHYFIGSEGYTHTGVSGVSLDRSSAGFPPSQHAYSALSGGKLSGLQTVKPCIRYPQGVAVGRPTQVPETLLAGVKKRAYLH